MAPPSKELRNRIHVEPAQPRSRQGIDPRDYGARCSECPFARDGQPNKPILGEGPTNPVGIVVGEFPGRDEVDTGRPFTGPAAQVMDNILLDAGLARGRLFMVNATCCAPRSGEEKDFRAAVAACRPALLKQLALFPETTPVLAAGKWAMVGLNGSEKKGGIAYARGFIRKEWVIPHASEATGDTRGADGNGSGTAETGAGEGSAAEKDSDAARED